MQKNTEFQASARRVLRMEAEAVAALETRIGEGFAKACEILLACRGRVVVTGMGKSGHIGSKLAATLASTGTPAFFVHPGEASHGDLGMITPGDVVIALSNSGETGEVLTILPLIKRMKTPLISMTGKPDSTLARMADANLDVGVAQEACPLNLAPTSSTTATLAMGDALAVTLLEARGFTAEDFALSHPGGSLGRRLLLMVEDVMHKGDEIPKVSPDAMLFDALFEITRKGRGMTTIVDATGTLLGVFTDGDLRRTLDHAVDLKQTPIRNVMNTHCTTVKTGILAAECLRIMEEKKINGLIVVDDANKPVGVLNMLTLLRAGVF